MSGDPAHRHNSADVNSQAVFDALDRVVAETPLGTQQRADEGGFAAPLEAAAPPARVSIPSPKPVLKVVGAKPVSDHAVADPVPLTRAPKPPPVERVWPSTASELEPFVAENPETYQEPSSIPRRWNVAQVAAIVLGIVAGVELFLLVSQARGRGRGDAVTTPAGSTVTVESTPSGAAIIINGQQRGKTPSTLTLNPGEYAMSLVRGTVARYVPLIVRGETNQHIYFAEAEAEAKAAAAPEPSLASRVTAAAPSFIPPPANTVGGWVSVDAPIDVQLFERGAIIGSNQSDRIMLPIGRHVIEAVNTSLGYKTSSTVQVAAGSVARLRLEMPPGTLNINALPWADVAVDGKRLGPTPLGNVSLSIGPHEIVFTHPQLGERRQTVTVTRNGVNRVSVNLNQR